MYKEETCIIYILLDTIVHKHISKVDGFFIDHIVCSF